MMLTSQVLGHRAEQERRGQKTWLQAMNMGRLTNRMGGPKKTPVAPISQADSGRTVNLPNEGNDE